MERNLHGPREIVESNGPARGVTAAGVHARNHHPRATLPHAMKRTEAADPAVAAYPAPGTRVAGFGFIERTQIPRVANRARAVVRTSVQIVQFVLFGKDGAEAFKTLRDESDERDTG